MILAILISLLPLVYWWRFRETRLDRDFGPYTYCGVFKCGYLKDGMRDIKPPLIHLGYQIWLRFPFMLKLSLNQRLRLLPLLALSVSVYLVAITLGMKTAFILSILFCSPYLWTHMANTEWLTLSLISISIFLNSQHPYTSMMVLGLLPLVNQKNVLLIVPVAWALGLNLTPTIQSVTFLLLPTILFIGIGWKQKQLGVWKLWLWDIPKRMGKNRKVRSHIMGMLHLFIPFIYKLALILAIVDYKSPWFIVFLAVVAMSIASKQIVPHHFILWALPLALCANPGPMFFVGWAILWFVQDWPIWQNPKLIYALTFRYRNSGISDYGKLLEDADEVIDWLKKNTAEDEAIWVNGAENQIYLEANRKATAMSIIEAQGIEPRLDLPRVIVHSAATPEHYDYTPGGYEHVLISPRGFYTILQRKGLIV